MAAEVFHRLVIAQIVLLGFQILMYFGVEVFEKNPHDIAGEADARIPLLPATVMFYVLWFPLIALFPLFLYDGDPEQYGVYMIATVIDIVISVIVYLIYPTTFERAEPPDTFWGRVLKLVYKGSFKGVNCMPSLHCSLCYIVTACAVVSVGISPVVRACAIIVSALIVFSTVTTKQHVLIDVVTALPVAAVSLAAGGLIDMDWLIALIGGAK